MMRAILGLVAAAVFLCSPAKTPAQGPDPAPLTGRQEAVPESFPPLPQEPADYAGVKLLVFISSSVPLDTVRDYMDLVEPIKNRVVFVLRGFVGDPTSFRETLAYTEKLLCGEDGSFGDGDCMDRTVDVNPNLFRIFGIDAVPAFVVIESGEIGSCSGENFDGTYYVSFGDAHLAYHLSRMAKKGSVTAKRLLRNLKRSFYD